MTYFFPTDGFGIYEGTAPSLGQSVFGPRLDAIAAAGFKVIVNDSLLFGSIANITAYINYAAGKGMSCAITLHNPVIWDTVQYPTSAALAAEYVTLYAACGSPTSNWDQVFSQFVVNQLKGLSGVYGYYIGDEVVSSQHAAMLNHTGFIHSADSTRPRIIVEAGGTNNACANSTSIFYDCADIMGDDYYPIGASAAYSLTTAQTAAGIEGFCIAHSISPCMVLQAFSWANYGRGGQPWPTNAQMIASRNNCIQNMKARLVLWYSYFDVISAGAPALQWYYLSNAINGRSGICTFPTTKRRGIR